ncbi:uncharacterized protein PSFLO_03554 [Pseudozyma flocculosa]|uniref:Uncharacterized protein n=1 Tax=Pseudozyma flocculosa TaxID=84751 RepID=A0A5C3F325_9BASI|nr:uncharacterized protein PSFLO_03554 [Pseudozyma flocculosa]
MGHFCRAARRRSTVDALVRCRALSAPSPSPVGYGATKQGQGAAWTDFEEAEQGIQAARTHVYPLRRGWLSRLRHVPVGAPACVASVEGAASASSSWAFDAQRQARSWCRIQPPLASRDVRRYASAKPRSGNRKPTTRKSRPRSRPQKSSRLPGPDGIGNVQQLPFTGLAANQRDGQANHTRPPVYLVPARLCAASLVPPDTDRQREQNVLPAVGRIHARANQERYDEVARIALSMPSR